MSLVNITLRVLRLKQSIKVNNFGSQDMLPLVILSLGLGFALAAPQFDPDPSMRPPIDPVHHPPPPGVSVPVITKGPRSPDVGTSGISGLSGLSGGRPCKRREQNFLIDGVPLSKVITV